MYHLSPVFMETKTGVLKDNTLRANIFCMYLYRPFLDPFCYNIGGNIMK